MLDLFKIEPSRLFLQLENQPKEVSQSQNEYLIDDKEYIKEQNGEAAVKKAMARAVVVNHVKFNAVHEKVSSGHHNEFCGALASLISKETNLKLHASQLQERV